MPRRDGRIPGELPPVPEGHVIHRHARLQAASLGGGPIEVSSPQGRFAAGAAVIDGRRIEAIDALGKHLFYRFEGDEALHVHLGLFGRFRTFKKGPAELTANTRLMLRGDAAITLIGPTVCELIGETDEAKLRDRLGPDPLDPSADPTRFVEALGRRTVPIGAALLDQSALAGIGNVYRAEILFRVRIDPHRPARELSGEERMAIWEESVEQLRRGERSGRIVTVDLADVGATRASDLPRRERVYVYRRAGRPCRRCDATIVSTRMAGRSVFSCPACQH